MKTKIVVCGSGLEFNPDFYHPVLPVKYYSNILSVIMFPIKCVSMLQNSESTDLYVNIEVKIIQLNGNVYSFPLSFRCHDRDPTGCYCQDWDYDVLSMFRLSPLYENEKVWIYIVYDQMHAKASDYKVVISNSHENKKKNIKKYCEVGNISIRS